MAANKEKQPGAAASDVAQPAANRDEYDEWIAARGDKRGAFGGVSLKLSHPPIPGFALRWVNDTDGGLRMSKAIDAGFTFVNGPDGRRISRVVGVAATGGGLRAYLMKRPEEFSNEDRAALQEKRDALISQTLTQVREGLYPKLGPDGRPMNKIEERSTLK